jgi:hypothetical protein
MADHLSKQELGDFLARLQQAALTGYPNPGRKGCPGPQVLREVASASSPFAHPAYEHIKTCSPCLQEMLHMQGAVVLKRQKATAVRTRSLVAGCFALGLLLMLGAVFVGWLDRKTAHEHVAAAPVPATIALDFRSIGPFRGADDASAESLVHVPSKLVALQITLPFGSDDGTYSVEIRDPQNEAVLKSAAGVAKILDGETRLSVASLDLSGVPPGQYSFAFRHADASWHKARIAVP